MCGIAGIISRNNNKIEENEIREMTGIVSHRGPDGDGYYFGNSFAFGHRRLAILDLTEDGKQPMSYAGKYTIIFNGEIYNYVELKEQLSKDGYSFNTQTDTEVILASYDKWGESCVDYFVGMWSFAIYDSTRNHVFCSRDRFGVKPFYYLEIGGKFAFASEIKQFTTLEDWVPVANSNMVIDYLVFGKHNHTNETMFQNVFQLRAGHNLIYDLNRQDYKIVKYYSLEDTLELGEISIGEASSRFKRLFRNAVKMHLRSDVKTGSCLSGGLDSSSIVCVVNELLKQENIRDSQETVSACFGDKRYDEQEFIDEVVKQTKVVSHKVFPEFRDLIKNFDSIAWAQDEPSGSMSIFAQWSIFKVAKEKNITVMLDGQGSDELLAGYTVFRNVYTSELLRKLRIFKFLKEIFYQRKSFGESFFKSMLFGSTYLLPNSIRGALRSKSIFGGFKWAKIDKSYYVKHFKNLYKSEVKTIRDYSLVQMLYSSLPALLHWEDRNSMAHSIESRVPFLDHRFVEFIFSLPSHSKISKGITKFVLREALANTIPEKIKSRTDKMGFVTPEESWIREHSEEIKKEIIEACKYLDNLVDEQELLRWYNSLIKSGRNTDFTVWRIISLGRWFKVFNVTMPL